MWQDLEESGELTVGTQETHCLERHWEEEPNRDTNNSQAGLKAWPKPNQSNQIKPLSTSEGR